MDFTEMTDKQILTIVEPIMDNLMDASTNINHEQHVRDFTDRLKNIVTPAHLEKVCQRYQTEKGYFTQRQFVSVFKRPEAVAVVWKQGFSKVKGEFVAELLLIKENERYLVDHTMIF